MEDAKRGFEQSAPPSDGSDAAANEEAARWQDTLLELKTLVTDEFKAGLERNASLAATYEAERKQRLELEQRLQALMASPPPSVATASTGAPLLALPNPTTLPGSIDTSSAATMFTGAQIAQMQQPSGQGAALVGQQQAGSIQQASADAAGRTATEPASSVASSAPAETGGLQVTQSTTPSATGTNAGNDAGAPPTATAANSGACVGKRCPAGYTMVDRGDRCTCRPQS